MTNLEILKSIAEQLMSKRTVELQDQSIPVKRTSSHRLRMVTFELDGRKYDAIEQNRDKPSRWGQLARKGHNVVQFRDVATNKYVAVAIDGDESVRQVNLKQMLGTYYDGSSI
jgi:hypothetical protein